MKIGIDVSQLAHPQTGVANYLKSFLQSLLNADEKNEYILFFSSLRKNFDPSFLNTVQNKKVTVKIFRFPPLLLHFVWNVAHSFPIENLVGQVDIFIASDWTQPPTLKAKKVTIVYDLIVYKYPEETNHKWSFSAKTFRLTPNIVEVQKKRLGWVKNEADLIFCISEATKKDVKKILGVGEQKLRVIYPGV